MVMVHNSNENTSFSEVMKAMAKDPMTVIVCLVLTLTGWMHGYDNGSVAGLQNMNGYRSAMGWGDLNAANVNEDHITEVQTWAVPQPFLIAATVTAFLAGQIADKIGRKPSMFIGACFFIFGGLLQSLAGIGNSNGLAMMTAGRALSGMSVGFLSCVGPMYSSEIATPKIRGFMTSFYQININVSILTANIFTYFVQDSHSGWRYMLGIQIVLGAIVAFAATFMPESPKWLLNQGEKDMALTSLKYLRKEGHQEELDEITNEMENERRRLGTDSKSYPWSKLLKSPVVKYTLMVGVLVQFLQILSGINGLVFYSGTIYESVGLDSFKMTMVENTCFLLGVIAELFLIDMLGRRTLMLWGASFQAIFLGVAGSITLAYGNDLSRNKTAGDVMVAMLCLFFTAFGTTWGPLAWLYCSEIFSPQARGKGQSVTTAVNWGANIIVTVIMPYMINWSAGGVFILFCATCVITVPVTFFLIPETKGVSLERMDLLFDAKAHGGFKKLVRSNIRKELPEIADEENKNISDEFELDLDASLGNMSGAK